MVAKLPLILVCFRPSCKTDAECGRPRRLIVPRSRSGTTPIPAIGSTFLISDDEDDWPRCVAAVARPRGRADHVLMEHL